MPQLYLISEDILCANCMCVSSYCTGINNPKTLLDRNLSSWICYPARGLNTGQDVHKITVLHLVFITDLKFKVSVLFLHFLSLLHASFLPCFKVDWRLCDRLAACPRCLTYLQTKACWDMLHCALDNEKGEKKQVKNINGRVVQSARCSSHTESFKLWDSL